MLFCFQLYSWGGGACLGCGSPEAVSFKPRLVEDLQSTHVVDISCGDSHCLALTHGKLDFKVFAYWVIFHYLLSSADYFQNQLLKRKIMNTIYMFNRLDPDQA